MCDTYGLGEVGNIYSGECPAGFYCPAGSTTDTKKTCETGFYCPVGSPRPIGCPPGTYGPAPRLTDDSQCINAPGLACEGYGNTIGTCRDCEAGWYCPRGAKSRFEILCPRHYYCDNNINNSSLREVPIPCPTGQYQPRPGETSCINCPAGYHCDYNYQIPAEPNKDEFPAPCPLGYFCPAGTLVPTICPDGTYGTRMRLRAVEDCVACPAGYYCSGGNLTVCSSGHYCTGGASPDYIENNYIFLNQGPLELTDSTHYTGNGRCPDGHFCPEGSAYPVPCPPGSYNTVSGSSSEFDCVKIGTELVDQGKYIGIEGARVNIGKPCEGGFKCDVGASIARPSDESSGGAKCRVGHECIAGIEKECGLDRASYQVNEGQKQCVTCPEGHFCNGNRRFGITVGVSLPLKCPAGSYCPEATIDPIECELGTFNPLVGQTSSVCQECLPGKMCDSSLEGRQTGKDCPAGFYCLSNTKQESEMKDCPPGAFCKVNSSSAHLCEVGTFNPDKNNADEKCSDCTGGSFCFERGLSAPNGPCSPGYYCPEGKNLDDPRPGYRTTSRRRNPYESFICEPGFRRSSKCGFALDSHVEQEHVNPHFSSENLKKSFF